MTGIFIRRLAEERALPESEFLKKINYAKPVFSDFQNLVIIPLEKFWREKARVFIYKKAEEWVSEINFWVRKLENKLMKAVDYIHGKNFPEGNGKKSKYWNGINEFKNGLPREDESEENTNEK